MISGKAIEEENAFVHLSSFNEIYMIEIDLIVKKEKTKNKNEFIFILNLL
jgi:hypothetical protein